MNSTHSEITQSEEAFIKKTALDGNGQTDMTDCWRLNGTCLNDADAYMQGSRVSCRKDIRIAGPHTAVDIDPKPAFSSAGKAGCFSDFAVWDYAR